MGIIKMKKALGEWLKCISQEVEKFKLHEKTVLMFT